MPFIHPLTLVSAAISAKDIRTPASVYQFIPAAKGNVQWIVRLTVAGSGDYVVYLTHQWAGAGVVSIVGPKTTIPLLAGETQLEFVSLWIGVEATDVFEVMVDGLAGDSAVTGDIRIYADNPSIFDPAADTVVNVTNLDVAVSSRAATGEAETAVAGIDKTGYALSDAGIDGVLDEVVAGTDITFRQALRVVLAILAGLADGGGTDTHTFRDPNDTKDVVTMTVTPAGDRTAISLDLT